MTALESELIAEAWSSLTSGSASPVEVALPELTGQTTALPSRFAATETATASIATALMAAVALRRNESAGRGRSVLHRGQVAAAVRSERFFTAAGRSAGMGFAPLSRFWRASDGWVRTHANYPWHRRALLQTLGTDDGVDAVADAIAERSAVEIESSVFAAGGIAASVRTWDEWQIHPQGVAVHAEPLISHQRVEGAAPREDRARVLDLTRVIAGPVCTRFLASLGADVLRIDPPNHLDMEPGTEADTLLGKRSSFLDAATSDGKSRLHELLSDADVLVFGYRPGAADHLGLVATELAARHPGLVLVFLDAWGHTGPWAGRRGFDSVVQAPTGIAAGESDDGDAPGVLPCQLLDHGTGYLAAAAALDGLRRQRAEGGTHIRRLSLARTAAWLTSRPPVDRTTAGDEDDATAWLQTMDGADATVVAVRPPGAIDGNERDWPSTPTRYGRDAPAWRST